MRLGTFRHQGRQFIGLVNQERVSVLGRNSGLTADYSNMKDFLKNGGLAATQPAAASLDRSVGYRLVKWRCWLR